MAGHARTALGMSTTGLKEDFIWRELKEINGLLARYLPEIHATLREIERELKEAKQDPGWMPASKDD